MPGGIFFHGPRSVKYSFKIPVPEIIDRVFAKTSQNARFLLSENERFGLVFVKTGSINSGTGLTSVQGQISSHMCTIKNNIGKVTVKVKNYNRRQF
jgi:hypothetical protein